MRRVLNTLNYSSFQRKVIPFLGCGGLTLPFLFLDLAIAGSWSSNQLFPLSSPFEGSLDSRSLSNILVLLVRIQVILYPLPETPFFLFVDGISRNGIHRYHVSLNPAPSSYNFSCFVEGFLFS